MANTFSPFGFAQRSGTGSSPTYEQVVLPIASTNTTPIFFGDPVVQATGTTGLPTGFIQQATGTPQTLAVSGGSLTAGVLTLTFTASTAPPVGSYVVVTGGTSTASTANGAWLITASTTTTLSFNFPGAYSTGTATAYVYQQLAGVFVGCVYLSTAQKRQVWSNYWPGSDTTSTVTGYCITDPNAQFTVQTGNSNTTSTALGVASIGQNIGFNYSLSGASPATVNGNTANGISTYFADQYTLLATNLGGYDANPLLPFRIVSLANSPLGTAGVLSGQNGSDPTTAYNYVVVGFNNAVSKQLSSI